MTKFVKILFVIIVIITASLLTQSLIFGGCTAYCFNESAAEAYCESYCIYKGSTCKSVGAVTSCSCIGTTCRCNFWFECWNGQEYRGDVDYPNCPQC